MNFVIVRKVVKKEVEVQNLPDLISQAQKKSGKSVIAVCKAVDISRSYWYKLIGGSEKAIAWEKLQKLEEVLGADFGVNF